MKALKLVLPLCFASVSFAAPVPTRRSSGFLRSLNFDNKRTSSKAAGTTGTGSSVSRSLAGESQADRIAKLIDMLVPESVRDVVSLNPLSKIADNVSKAAASSSGAAAAAAVTSQNKDGSMVVIPVIATVDRNGVATAKALDQIAVPGTGSVVTTEATQRPPIAAQVAAPVSAPISAPVQGAAPAAPVVAAAADPLPQAAPVFTPVVQKAVPPANAIGIDGTRGEPQSPAAASNPLGTTNGVFGDPNAPANAPTTPSVPLAPDTTLAQPSLADVAAANGFAIVPVKAGDTTGIAIIPMSAATRSTAGEFVAPITLGQATAPLPLSSVGVKAAVANTTLAGIQGTKAANPATGDSSPRVLPNGSRVLNKTPLGAGHMGSGVSDARRAGAVNPTGSLKDSTGDVELDSLVRVPAAKRPGSASASVAAPAQVLDAVSNVVIDATSGAMLDDGSPFVTVIESSPVAGVANPGFFSDGVPVGAGEFGNGGEQFGDQVATAASPGQPGLSGQSTGASTSSGQGASPASEFQGRTQTIDSTGGIVPGQPILPAEQLDDSNGGFI